jgi:hypothetical protein
MVKQIVITGHENDARTDMLLSLPLYHTWMGMLSPGGIFLEIKKRFLLKLFLFYATLLELKYVKKWQHPGRNMTDDELSGAERMTGKPPFTPCPGGKEESCLCGWFN